MEDKPGNLLVLPLLIFYSGSHSHIPRSCDMFLSRRPIVVPLGATRDAVGQTADPSHCVVERDTPEIGPEWKNPLVAPAYILEDAGS